MSGSPQRRRCGGGLFRIARIIHDGIVADCATLAAASKLPGGTPTGSKIQAIAQAGSIGNPLGGYCVLTQPSSSLTLSIALKGYGLCSVLWGDGTAIQSFALNPTNATTVARTWGVGANMTVIVTGNITDFNATNGSEGGLLHGLSTLTNSMFCSGNLLTFSDMLTSACWPNLTNIVYFSGSSMTIGGTLTASFWPNLTSTVYFYGSSMTIGGLVNFAKAVYIYISTTGALTYNTSSGQFTFPANMQDFYIRPGFGSWTQAMTDASCIDLAATTWAGSKIVDERGNCAAPSAASLTARTVTLPGKGVTVNTN